MTYSTTITEKGQITIPKPIREVLNLERGDKLFVEVKEKARKIEIKAPEDFLEFAKKIRVKRKVDPVKAREYMEAHYERA